MKGERDDGKNGLINGTGRNTGEMDKEYTKEKAERNHVMREVL
jgi:hypothetical protein